MFRVVYSFLSSTYQPSQSFFVVLLFFILTHAISILYALRTLYVRLGVLIIQTNIHYYYSTELFLPCSCCSNHLHLESLPIFPPSTQFLFQFCNNNTGFSLADLQTRKAGAGMTAQTDVKRQTREKKNPSHNINKQHSSVK